MTTTIAPRRDQHDDLPPGRAEAWIAAYEGWPTPLFPQTIGARLDEVRDGYARMSLPYRVGLDQPAGFVHGGAIATLLDTVVVPAVGAVYEQPPTLLTIDLQVRFLGAARTEDLVAEGWVVKRGRTIAFCEASVTTTAGVAVADGWATYRVIEGDR
jgi:uncharacterized protein (TIGR00369 family)